MESSFKSKLEEKLFQARKILLYGEVSQESAQAVSERLLAMAEDSDKDIHLLINSQGGHVESGDTIFDMIQFVTPRVKILGTGWVASAGALIFVSVPLEDRYCLPNTRFMLHQPLGGVGGRASDIHIEAQEILKMKQRLNRIFADRTGQAIEKVEKDTDRNYWMGPDEAIEYGLLGKVIRSETELA